MQVVPVNGQFEVGYCQCGCGKRTKVSTKDYPLLGHVKGQPVRFLPGHNGMNKRRPDDRIPFKIDGVECTFLPLTKGFITIIDFADYPRLCRHSWQPIEIEGHVAVIRSGLSKGKKFTIYLHNEILPPKEGLWTDHVNRNPLDNRRANLRYATPLENARNRGITSRNTSGFKGVSWHEKAGKWRATIRVEGDLISLGLFGSRILAAAAYDRAAKVYFGEYAVLNLDPMSELTRLGEF